MSGMSAQAADAPAQVAGISAQTADASSQSGTYAQTGKSDEAGNATDESREKNPAAQGTENSYRYFANRDCKYFPCHPGADPENFNCLFCYCPLYALADKCGGNFYYKDNGVKVCTNCRLPHLAGNYDYVTKKLADAIHEGRLAARDQTQTQGVFKEE